MCVKADEPSDSGNFTEQYKCDNCGATGTISGREEDRPENWNKYGRCFA
jgi:hypothetical protein